jgi:hypothetical protein
MSVQKRQEFAWEKLGSGDHIVGAWPGGYSGKHGYIVLSKKRLLFVTEKETLRDTAELLLDKGYDQFKGNGAKNDGQLVLTDVKGEKYSLATPYLPRVQSVFEEQRKHLA